MSAIAPRPPQRSTGRPTWASLRRERLAVAEAALTHAGRCLELIPADDDAHRLAAWAFRLASRCRSERNVA